MRSRVKRKDADYSDAPAPGTPERLAWLRTELDRASEFFLFGREDVHWVIRGSSGQEQIVMEWKHPPALHLGTLR